jgi:hypothetical protein
MNISILWNATLLVVAVVALWSPFQWKKSTTAQRFLIVLVVEVFIAAFVEVVLVYFKRHNLWVISLSTLVEFVLIALIIYHLKIKESEKTYILFAGAGFIIFWIVSKLTFEPFSVFNSYTSVVSRLFQIVISVSLLFDILKDTSVRIKNDSRIWIASGIIIYSTGSLLLCILFMEILKVSPQLIKALWPINWILVIISELLYARAILCRVLIAQKTN